MLGSSVFLESVLFLFRLCAYWGWLDMGVLVEIGRWGDKPPIIIAKQNIALRIMLYDFMETS